MNLYQYPQYYEVAFSFRNIPQEVDFFESAIEKFSRIKVKSVFELASGTSPYLEEWHKRGYRYFGLDKSSEMLAFARREAREKNIDVRLLHGDMKQFSLGRLRVDLAYVLVGSLYVTSNGEFLKHLDCVSRVLKRGGLYLLDGVVWFNILSDNKQTWTISKEGIRVKTAFHAEIRNETAQTFIERLVFDVHDHGLRKRLSSNQVCKFFFPQEFLSLVQCHNQFEFLGWFNDFNLKKPARRKGRQIVVLRKK